MTELQDLAEHAAIAVSEVSELDRTEIEKAWRDRAFADWQK
jgi:hypothetical protein